MMDGGPPGRTQTAEGLDAILSPRSVAVIGASPDPDSIGHRILASVLRHGFTGTVHPIHPKAREILGLQVAASVLDVPGDIDLAIVAVPAAVVLQVAKECAKKGVRGLVVITAGFREAGPGGAELEQELGRLARANGMRIVGPNCLGIVNADPKVRLHAIFSDTPVKGGSIALMTQSGALGIALLERAHGLGLGVGRFVSMGNKIDVSGNDLLLHWEKDAGVRLILMHLESVGNPRNFVRIARRVMPSTPILLVKGGRTSAGAKAAGSHTGAMMEADALVDAMVQQAGVVRVATVEELFDATLALSLQALPAGDRIGIVTNSGGPAILMADALPAGGLRLGELGQATLEACRERLPPGAAVANPLDMLAGASPETLRACLVDLLRDDGIDAVVAMATPLLADDVPWANAILEARANVPTKTLVAVVFGRDNSSPGFSKLIRAGIPTYTFPENAVNALAAMNRVATTRREASDPGPAPPDVSVRPPVEFTPDAKGWVPTGQALTVLERLGARRPVMALCKTVDEAARAAAAMGFPVALKVQALGLVHKTEVGAVRLGLRSPEEVRSEGQDAWRRVGKAGFPPEAILVQQMAPSGTEMLVGAVRDPKFGPVVSVGLGGIYTEALHDVAVRLAPVTPQEAERMVASLRASALLKGVRGEPRGDIEALRDLVVAIGGFLDAEPAVAEVEANPVRVLAKGKGVVAVDARLRLAGTGSD